MQTETYPFVKDLVLIGGGHAHALILRTWAMRPMPGVRMTVINPGPTAPYTGMLPGHVAGHYPASAMMIDLVRLARAAGARLILDRAAGLDLDGATVRLADRPPLPFDVASIDIGIGSGLPDLPGFSEHGIAAKPLGAFAQVWQAFVDGRPRAPGIVILGAGLGGVELALAAMHRLRQSGTTATVTLVDPATAILPDTGDAARRAIHAELASAGITLRLGQKAQRVADRAVHLADGTSLPSDFTLSVAGARPQAWLADTGLHLTEGFVTVGPTLGTSDARVFAVGDCAHLSHAPRPKAGVFAVRAARVLDHNLRATLAETGTLRRYHPQRDYLKLVSLGRRRALADKHGLVVRGAWVWRWKDRIDRRFMAMLDTPVIPVRQDTPSGAAAGLADLLAEVPLCGACGAKLSPSVLTSALAGLPPPQRPEVLSGPGDDAAILARPGGGRRVMTTDHLRGFTNDYRLMARVAAVHALGDIWAMGATPEHATAQVILPRMSPRLQGDTLTEIMAEATAVFRAAGADIVGGHSSQGTELTIGFTVTGLADRPVSKGGMKPGDALILTKPIGVGVILAAEMSATRMPDALLGEVWAGCVAGMQRPLQAASRLLAPHARAMTDVTGFGLAGHLAEMLAAGDPATVEITLDAVPVYPGAAALAAQGQASSLMPANRAALIGRISVPVSPRADLLFDPQTCGGLLAAVPGNQAQALVAALRAAGDPAAIIGHIGAGPGKIIVR
ncbi:MAG: selenide, water dikinase SelD [Pseudomonadota bacterium]